MLTLLTSLSGPAFGTGGWELEADEDGIRVETRSLPDSDIRAFRAHAVVNVHVESILALMDDAEGYPQWIHGCSASRFIDQPDFFHRLAYQVNDMPLWVTDRDLVMKVAVTEEKSGTFRVDLHNQPQAYPDQGLVRVNRLQGQYLLKPLGPERTEIVWIQHTEPGGFLPGWLVNQLLRNIPLNSLRDLRRLVEAKDSPYRFRRLRREADGSIIGWTD